MYAQNHQRHQIIAQKDKSGNSSQSQPGFQRMNPPIGGYYAPSQQKQSGSPTMPHDPDSFARGRFSAEQRTPTDHYSNQHNPGGYPTPYQHGPQPIGEHLASQVPQQEGTRPPLQINTNTNQPGFRNSLNRHLVTAPPILPPQFPPASQSPYERPRSRSPYTYGGIQGTNPTVSSHVIDLHKRSRSPRIGRRLSEDEHLDDVDRNDPASQLGTFSNIAAPRSGGADSSEQEAPWRIGLPISEEEESKRKSQTTLLEQQREDAAPRKTKVGDENAPPTKDQKEEETENVHPRISEEEWRKEEQAQHEPSVAERVMGVQRARGPLPLQGSASAGNAMARSSKTSPVELPGSKAPGDDSDEEIVMSSTAYPGQEWAPDNLGYGGNWDD
jgi:hypothetical protein